MEPAFEKHQISNVSNVNTLLYAQILNLHNPSEWYPAITRGPIVSQVFGLGTYLHQMGKRIQQESNGYHKEIKWIIENKCIRNT